MKNPLDRVGKRGPIVMAASAAVIGVSLQPVVGTDGWAGLGQWVGGLGAFFAAWAALRIAGDEHRREATREADKLYVNAHYVSAGWVLVEKDGESDYVVQVNNRGNEPVLDVQLQTVHVHGRTTVPTVALETDDGPRHVLLPCEPWQPAWRTVPNDLGSTLVARFMGPGGELEITFRDLGGNRWRRVGSRPPVPDCDPRP